MSNLYVSTGLQVETADDAMEITSESGQKTFPEEDIDIDLDLEGDQNDDGEDEYMIEDADSMQDEDTLDLQEQDLRKDDEMIDETLIPGMEDEALANDEDLIDAEEESYEPIPDLIQTVRNEVVEEGQYDSHDQYHQVQGLTDETANHERNSDTETSNPRGFLKSINTQELEDLRGPSKMVNHSPTLDTLGGVETQDGENYDKTRVTHVENKADIEDAQKEFSNTRARSNQAAADLQSSNEVSSTNILNDNGTQQKEDTMNHLASQEGHIDSHTSDSIHGDENAYQHTAIYPVKVVYEENEISLFPPGEEDVDQTQTYLLQDPTLANQNIYELLAACRLVLGESIEVQDELHIEFESLDLRFSESTIESSTISLGQIVEIYLQLQHNDEIDSPSSLCMTLTTKTKPANRLDYLYTAIAAGKGLSELTNSTQIDAGFDESQNDFIQDYGQDVLRRDPDDLELGFKDGENVEEDHVGEAVKGKSYKDTDRHKHEESPSKDQSVGIVLPTTADQSVESEYYQENHDVFLVEDADWYDDNLENDNEARETLQFRASPVDNLLNDAKLIAASKVDVVATEIDQYDDLREGAIRQNPGTESTDRDDQEFNELDDELFNEAADSNASLHQNDHVGEPPNAQSQFNYHDKVDDQTEEGNHESSAASSTVRGDGSVALIDTEGILAEGEAVGENHNDPLISGDHEELPKQSVGDLALSDDGDNYSEGEYDEYEEDGHVDVSLRHNELEGNSHVIEPSNTGDVEHLAHDNLTAPSVGDGSVFDDDEITYDDDEEEAISESPLHGQDSHVHVPTSTSSSTPLKRVRTASEDIDTRETTPQGIKRIRSQ